MKDPEDKPKYHVKLDWIPAMLAHCMIWSFCVHLPIFLLGTVDPIRLIASFWIQALFHFSIDDLKRNQHKISTIVDQCIHIFGLIVLISL